MKSPTVVLATVETIAFDTRTGLVPVVVQDVIHKDVLMLGYASPEAVQLTLQTKHAWFWSRSREKLWRKGEQSGDELHVRRVMADCDSDALIYHAVPRTGSVCHTTGPDGFRRNSCFFRIVSE